MNLDKLTPANVYRLYKFMVEFLAFCTLFIIRLPKREHFGRRVSISLFVCFLLSSYWSQALASVQILSAVRYLLLFMAVTISIWLSYRCSKLLALSCAMGGYAAQHFFHRLCEILDLLLPDRPEWIQAVSYMVLLGAVMLVVRFIFTRNINEGNYHFLENSKNFSLCGFVLLCTVFFSVIYVTYSPQTPVPMLIVCALYDCVCCGMALWVQFGLFEVKVMQGDMEIVRQLWHQEKLQMELSKENIDLINIKCHDMKHLIKHLEAKGGQATENELQSICELIEIYDFSVNTGHDTLNLVLSEKSPVCRKEGIRLNCIADGEKLDMMEESDVYSLFGNALDNAIRAVLELPDKDKRVITLTIRPALGMLLICIENYYNAELQFSDGLPITSKDDGSYHGYGLKSMRYLVEKYGGEMTLKTDDGVFTVTMLLPLEN